MQIRKLKKLKDLSIQSPISLKEIKHFMRVNTKHDDDLIKDIMQCVQAEVEADTNRALMQSEWELSIVNYSGNYIDMPKINTTSVVCAHIIEYKCKVEIPRRTFEFRNGIVSFDRVYCTPLITLKFIAGSERAKDIDPALKLAMKQRISAIYDGSATYDRSIFSQFKNMRL